MPVMKNGYDKVLDTLKTNWLQDVGHFCMFSKVTKCNLIITDSRGLKISHQAFLPRDT